METLKYTLIKSPEQYREYCNHLEEILERNEGNENLTNEIELLTLLIEKWDTDQFSYIEVDPIELLHSLMQSHQIKAKDLVLILGVSKGLISEILHYKRGLSKDIIRILSTYFKVSQEAFNRPYPLINSVNPQLHPAQIKTSDSLTRKAK